MAEIWQRYGRDMAELRYYPPAQWLTGPSILIADGAEAGLRLLLEHYLTTQLLIKCYLINNQLLINSELTTK